MPHGHITSWPTKLLRPGCRTSRISRGFYTQSGAGFHCLPTIAFHKTRCRKHVQLGQVLSCQGQQQNGSTGKSSAVAEDNGDQTSVVSTQTEIECVGTGMEASCTRVEHTNNNNNNATATNGANATQTDDVPGAPLLELLLLISPFFFWGSSMVAMKVVSPHTAPIFVGAFRLVPAGMALIGWAAQNQRPQPSGLMAWVAIAVFALFDGAFFQGFLAEGLQRTSAGLGSIIIDSQPITVAILASLFFGERLSSLGYFGMLLGVAGLLLLEVPPELLVSGTDALPGLLTGFPSALSDFVWDNGEWWMLLAAQSMAVGTVLVPWVARYVDPVMATGWHLLLGGLPLVVLSALQEGPLLAERLPNITGVDIALLLYVSLLGSAASYGVFFYNASRGNLTALSSLTFLTPMFAAAIGYLLLGETLTPLQLTGACVTLGAVTLINVVPKKSKE